jgi:release factor glutamine methyltransferase
MTIRDVVEKSIQFFREKKMDSPRLEAELLIAHVLKTDRVGLYMQFDKPLAETEIVACRDVIRRRAQGEPAAYITGERGFYGFVFHVEPGVLVPRPETELIVDEVLTHLKKGQTVSQSTPQSGLRPRILDLGTGTGCIGLSLLRHCPHAQLVGVDKAPLAQKVFQINSQKLGVSGRTQFISGDVEELIPTDLGLFDYIVGNPPYIAHDDKNIQASVKDFEPAIALFAADQGLHALRTWSSMFAPQVNLGGMMVFEMGAGQGPSMLEHYEKMGHFKSVYVVKDLSGLDRLITGVR